MIFPDLETARILHTQGNVIPVCSTIMADTETPVSVWLKLFKNAKHSFLLESVSGAEHVSRYSFLGGDPFMTFRVDSTKGEVSWEIEGAIKEQGCGDPVGRLRALLAGYKSTPVPGLPRFSGGAVGFFSYDAVRLWERVPDAHEPSRVLDDVFFGFYRDIIVFDSREHRLQIISNILPGDNPDFDAAYRDACHRIGTIADRMAVRLPGWHLSVRQKGGVTANVSRAEYEASVVRCKEYITAGDIFQVVLSQRFAVKVEADPFDLYRVLRTVNPSPYMYYLGCGSAQVIGASPEMLVRVVDGTAEVRPIAGTSRRGKTDAEDEALAAHLLADPKERAEHVMLVDLGRNDVGRVSTPGSVHVDDMMHIEKYSHVMHIVSNVTGRLKEGCDALDALFSCFPAGTLSGAPKIRAMEIIDEQENLRRGLYGGALGYIDFSGNLDSCIVIRTIVYKDGVAQVQAGAGIVADSVPSREFDECVNKASALFAAIRDAGAIAG